MGIWLAGMDMFELLSRENPRARTDQLVDGGIDWASAKGAEYLLFERAVEKHETLERANRRVWASSLVD